MDLTCDFTDLFKLAKKGKSGCLFCDPFPGMEVVESAHFRVLIDTFPISQGHLMISSKSHYGSAGEVPFHLQDELIHIKNCLQNEMLQRFGTVFFYEHGRAGCCMNENPDGSKCEHFHLHCLPVNLDLTSYLNTRFQQIKIDHYSQIRELFLEHGNYLYIEDNQNMFFYPVEDQTIESHLLRTLVCDALHIRERSNWEDYKDDQLLVQSGELVGGFNFNRTMCV